MKTMTSSAGFSTFNDDNQLHSFDDKPAIIMTNGTKYWLENGLWHRLDKPAMITNDGIKCWFKKGLLHRDNGPAIILADGTSYWYYEGEYIEHFSLKDYIIMVELLIIIVHLVLIVLR